MSKFLPKILMKGSRRANEGRTKGQIRVSWVLFLATFGKSLSQNVNVVGYRIKLSREYQPVGRMEGHFGQTFGLLLDTRNFRFGRFESADLEQARIFRVVKRADFKEDWFSKNYKCITPKRNYAYRVDITSRVVSHPGHVTLDLCHKSREASRDLILSKILILLQQIRFHRWILNMATAQFI